MFEYVNKEKYRLKQPKNEFNRTKRFEHTENSTFLSDDFRPIADAFETYSADYMIGNGVSMSSSPSFHDVSLDALDNVEEQSLKVLESEDFIIDNDKEK